MTGVKASDMLGKGNYEYSLPFYGERRPILIDIALEPREEILSKYSGTGRRADGIVGEAYMPALKTGEAYLLGQQASCATQPGISSAPSNRFATSPNVSGQKKSDITERKLAEEALAEEAIRRRILFEQSRDGIVVLDQNGKVYEANQRYAEMLGYSAEEIGRTPHMGLGCPMDTGGSAGANAACRCRGRRFRDAPSP